MQVGTLNHSHPLVKLHVGPWHQAKPGMPPPKIVVKQVKVIWVHLKRKGFPGGSDGIESACSTGDQGSIPGSGRSPGGGHGSPLQYSCLENPMDRGTWWATVHGVSQSQTRLKRLGSKQQQVSRIIPLPTAAFGGRQRLDKLELGEVEKPKPTHTKRKAEKGLNLKSVGPPSPSSSLPL